MDTTISVLENSREFYLALESREDWWKRWDIISDMWSVLGITREVSWLNNTSEYFKNIDKYSTILDKPWMSKQFNDWYDYLLWDNSSRNNTLMFYWFRDVLLWIFAGIPLVDVRLNFIKTLNKSWVSMDRAYVFSSWVTSENWMQSGISFEEYEGTIWKTIDTGKNTDRDLNALKWTITAYITSKYKGREITRELILELRKTVKKLDKLITSYIDNRFVPDAETLLAGWFNWFESIFDEKYDNIQSNIDVLKWWEVKLEWYKARKEGSSSKEYQDVFLLKNSGKFYLHIWTEYKEFIKKPTDSEIKISIKEYNKLSLTTYWEVAPQKERLYPTYSIEGKKIIAEAEKKWITPDLRIPTKENSSWTRFNLDSNKNEIYISKDEQLKIANEVIVELKKQNKEWVANLFGQWRLTEDLAPVEDRLDYYSALNNKNSKFLKEAIKLLESGKWISDELKQTFWILNYYNSTDDFLNAYALPKVVTDQIKWLDNLSPEQYVLKLKEINKNKDVKKAFDAIKGWPEALKDYRLANLESRLHSPKYRVDAKKHKYWARILTREEFAMSYKELQAEYKKRFDNKTNTQKFNQEFTWTFEDVYKFSKPAIYEQYLDLLLTETWPDWKDADGWSTMDLHERGMIEAWVLDVTWAELKEALKARWEWLPIQSLYDNPDIFINTARQAGYDYDTITTFLDLHNERWDEKIIHTTIDRSFSFTTKAWENITRQVKYDVYLRPECDNIYILPNSKSVQETKTFLTQNNAIFDLKLISPIRRGLVNMAGKAYVGGQVCMEAEMLASVVKDKAEW